MEAAATVGIPKIRVFEFTEPDRNNPQGDILPWTDIWASEEASASWKWRTFSSPEEAQEATAVVNYSSG